MPRSIREIAVLLILIGGGLVIIFSGASGRENGIETRILYMVARPFQQGCRHLSRPTGGHVAKLSESGKCKGRKQGA